MNFRYHLGIIGLRPVGSDQLLVPLTGAVVSGVQLISGDLYALVAGILSARAMSLTIVHSDLVLMCHKLDISALRSCMDL